MSKFIKCIILLCLLLSSEGAAAMTLEGAPPVVRVVVRGPTDRCDDVGKCEIGTFVGTGTFIAPNVVVTAAHVVEDSVTSAVQVAGDPMSYMALIASYDRGADLAILLIPDYWSDEYVSFCEVPPTDRYVFAYAHRRRDHIERTAGHILLYNHLAMEWAGDILIGPGFSGGPVWDPVEECIAGISVRALDSNFDPYSIYIRPDVSVEIFSFLLWWLPDSLGGINDLSAYPFAPTSLQFFF